eukprot:TRINITY_DN13849_c0_g2_i4.p2 TRINITY_DN13849_c0_g2~~TRINITY_DN13849_c0_g2_i4.p2  ORF type:complete len:241 (-),score=17.71 TRINITY_DN13849_c0_g2_i4:256-978(-)
MEQELLGGFEKRRQSQNTWRGRGRGKNVWQSPHGCLQFSVLASVRLDGKWVPHVQYVVCMAILDAVHKLSGANIDLKIKWPNDVYLRGQKIGGVLCQSYYQNGNYDIVIGVGLNLDNAEPTICLNDVIEKEKTGERIVREDLLVETMNFLEQYIQVLQFEGFYSLQEKYISNWMHSQQQVQLEEQDPDGNIIQVLLTIVGLSESGFLLGQEEQTQRLFELHPDGNSFDMMKGLIRRKYRT